MVIRNNKPKSHQDGAGTKAILKPKTNLETTTLHNLLQHESTDGKDPIESQER